jgi:hypothetical protein
MRDMPPFGTPTFATASAACVIILPTQPTRKTSTPSLRHAGAARGDAIQFSRRWGHGHHDFGGVGEDEGSYGVVFPLSQALPNSALTPGAFDPRITQFNIHQSICIPRYSKSVRPPESYTEPLKRKLIDAYGYTDHRLRDYELDHDAPISLGGAPADPRNLWPQPRHVIGGWGSYAKDRLKDRLHALVCRGQVPLAQAQYDIRHDWIRAYEKYVGPTPDATQSPLRRITKFS